MARPALESELKLNPDHALANLRLGQLLLVTDADAPQRAIRYLRKAIADSHTGLEAHRELGKALRLAGKYQEAFQELELVVRQKPDDELVHAQLAALYRNQGDAQHARKELEIQRQILQRKRETSLKARRAEADH
jgi:Flp pilus assembly protein TadD